jgi:hypothetical protein
VELVHKGTSVKLLLSYFPPAIYLQGECYLGSWLPYYKFGAERSYSEVSP